MSELNGINYISAFPLQTHTVDLPSDSKTHEATHKKESSLLTKNQVIVALAVSLIATAAVGLALYYFNAVPSPIPSNPKSESMTVLTKKLIKESLATSQNVEANKARFCALKVFTFKMKDLTSQSNQTAMNDCLNYLQEYPLKG